MATRAVTTILAKKNMLLARAGEQPLPRITAMAFGVRGINEDGKVVEPDERQNELLHEVLRKDIDGYEVVNDTKISYNCTLEENELAGERISEIALVDENGDLVAIKNFTAKGKDEDWKMIFTINDTM